MTVYALQWAERSSPDAWQTWRLCSDPSEARRLFHEASSAWEARPRPSWVEEQVPPYRLVSLPVDAPVGEHGVMGGDDPPGIVVILP